MIAYFDTSALVPLVIDEPASLGCERVWNEATRVVGVRLWYTEARAALAQAHRLGRLDTPGLGAAVAALENLGNEIDHVEMSEELVRAAGDIAQADALRGYDAVHLAAAVAIAASDVTSQSGLLSSTSVS